MEKEMSLMQIHDLARCYKDYREFKSQVDRYFNGTPETLVDNTQYKLVKNNIALDDVISSYECIMDSDNPNCDCEINECKKKGW